MDAPRSSLLLRQWPSVLVGTVVVAVLAVLAPRGVDATWFDTTQNTSDSVATGSWQITATAKSTCATTDAFDGWCWGENTNGQLGDGTTADRGSPTAVAGLLTTAAGPVVGADRHSCVVEADATVLCWGRNDKGQLGDGSTTGRTIPSSVTAPSGSGDLAEVASLAPGPTATHSCAVTTATEIWCWGLNSSGQLGDLTTTDRSVPTAVAAAFATAAASPVGTDTSSCVVQADATVACWGSNASGQLGDGTTTDRSRPVEVVGTTGSGTLGDVVDLDGATGGIFACALDSAGDVFCWGRNNKGQVGDGTTTDPRATPLQVVGVGGTGTLSDTTDIATGKEHACASTTSGVVCWGLNNEGQLGDGSTSDSQSPVQVVGVGGSGTLSAATQVVAGESHSCALVSGEVVCWGRNDKGQLGDGTTAGSSSPVQVVGVGGTGTLSGVTALAAGKKFVCALRSDTSVVCWGENNEEQLGDGTTTDSSSPVQVVGVGGTGTLLGVAAVAAGESHVCAVESDGTAVCWGRNDRGQLGDGTTTDSSSPVAVVGVVDLEEVGVGAKHSCATTATDELYCWGGNADGQLGDGSGSDQPTPTAVVAAAGTTRTGVAGAAVGSGHTCLVETGGDVFCWGANANSQLGDGTSSDSGSPVQVVGVGGSGTLGSATQVVAGEAHSCAVVSGEVVCWGRNDKGQLGDGTSTDSGSPVQVVGVGGTGTLSDVVALAAGKKFVCAVQSGGAVVCWGENTNGQLGDGTTTDAASPVEVAGVGGTGTLSAVDAVAAGESHACALEADGTAVCWGRNDLGQLGDGTTTDTGSPVEVSGVSDLDGLGVGAKHSCATTTADELYCWGRNADGQLGDASGSDQTTPVGVRGGQGDPLAPVLTATAGLKHSCMALMDLSVLCWGRNDRGQLGDGTTTDTAFPVAPVTTSGSGQLAGVRQVVAGDEHTCALLDDTTVVCWGRNDKGQLGNDSATGDTATPQQVVDVGGSGTLSGVTWLGAGAKHTCAVDSSHDVHCWGLNASGQLGDGTATDRDTPVLVAGVGGAGTLSGIRQVSAGADHSCAVSTADELYCWGANGSGQVGDGTTTTPRTSPRVVVGVGGSGTLADVRWVDGGREHTCAAMLDDTAVCWGRNDRGQVGDGTTTTPRTSPTEVVSTSGSGTLTPVGAVAAGSEHTCAFRRDDTTAYCWGRDDKGQLGNAGATGDSPVPVATDGP